MDKQPKIHVNLKVPKNIWDRFKIKAITKQKTNEQLLQEIIEKEAKK